MPYLYQEKLQKADDHYYNLLDYKGAIDLYKEVLEKAGEDTSIICKIANSYRLLNNAKEAEGWYRRAIINNESTIAPIYKLQFAQVLTINAKYDEALFWYKSYYKIISSDKRAIEAIKSIENISKLYYDTTFYVAYPVTISTEFAEFNPTYYNNGILFLTDRDNSKTGLVSRYFSAVDSAGNFATPTKFSTGIKTEYNEGPVSFYDNYQKMIFSQNYSPEKVSKKHINDIPLQLFSASREENGKWGNIQLLPFQDKNYSYTQPSVNHRGDRLFFSSNMPGGIGGTDLYMSKFENGNWSTPINLGGRINTSGDEMFPFIYQDTMLYFSSNGLGGLGGLDMFRINLKDSSKAVNLGVPMNSANDDLGIILDKDGMSGYFSSSRLNGAGSDDIYGFKLIRITLTIKIIDANTLLPVTNADIYFGDAPDGKKLGKTDNDGSCDIVVPVCQTFKLKIKKENYETKVYSFEPVTSTVNTMAVVGIKSGKDESDKVVLTDDDNKQLSDKDAIYKVQIMACRVPASNRDLNLKYKGNLPINKSYESNWYKYSIGEYRSYAEAKKNLIDSNVIDAFIVAYINNKKVHITIAKAATNETNVKSPIRRGDLRRQLN